MGANVKAVGCVRRGLDDIGSYVHQAMVLLAGLEGRLPTQDALAEARAVLRQLERHVERLGSELDEVLPKQPESYGEAPPAWGVAP